MRHRTVVRPVELVGVGVHTGEPCRVRILPRQLPGLLLRARDGQPVELGLAAVESTERSTCVAGVMTVEHLLAALWVAGVTAAELVVEGGEIPAMDGSALPFWSAIRRVGTQPLEAERPLLEVTEPLWVRDGGRLCAALPCPGLRVTYVVRLRDRPAQAVDLEVDEQTFERELAPARTWGYADEAEDLWDRGLALGASESNTLVLEGGAYRNRPRYEDEPARHKAVDLLGDLALLGAQLRAHVVAVAAGHELHLALARALAGQSGSDGRCR
ncbi:MAG: UDP-3-O-acyl-N-acetylglucosamine deacetylase [Armatimonadota bacterium]|nr:UDP-3-O-acyl-N-acetylglucosamine deacetylase [Armatimonadota bacterium]MDW8156031.1 UDP-3-O-acyl-N-acetylglucosamine deacetylase [Armatimonadota bacterium]